MVYKEKWQNSSKKVPAFGHDLFFGTNISIKEHAQYNTHGAKI